MIPPQAPQKVLKLLHETHIGISRMKSLARQFVWWPNMHSEIEQYVRNCATCQLSTKDPPVTSLHPWEWPGHDFMQTSQVHFLVRCISH